MGDRYFPFNDNQECDVCGNKGSYDFHGDNLCPKCLEPLKEE